MALAGDQVAEADNSVVETPVLDNTSIDLTTVLSGPIEEVPTTQKEADYDILIQGSDRRFPAIVLRRKHRGKGATILTISKNGQHKELYPAYEDAIKGYLERRQHSKTRPADEGSHAAAGDEWIDKTIQSVVRGQDNSSASNSGL